MSSSVIALTKQSSVTLDSRLLGNDGAAVCAINGTKNTLKPFKIDYLLLDSPADGHGLVTTNNTVRKFDLS